MPADMERMEAPTPYVWILGRTQTNGPTDYEAVHQIQNGYKITPLSQWGEAPRPAAAKIDPSVDTRTPPLEQVNSMPAARFFPYAAELIKADPPHVTDWSQIERLKRIGVEPGESFDFDKANPTIKPEALDGRWAPPTIKRVK